MVHYWCAADFVPCVKVGELLDVFGVCVEAVCSKCSSVDIPCVEGVAYP